MRAALALAACALLGGGAPRTEEVAPGGLLAVRGTVLAGRELEPLVDGVVLIDDDRIVRVAAGTGLALPAGTRVLDAGGGFVVPALIDNHVHVLDRIAGRERDLESWLEAGVGTLVDCGSTLAALSGRRDDEAAPRGPRVLASGPILTAPGGYPLLGAAGMPGLEVADSSQAARAARRLLAAGSDLLKVAVEAGFTSDVGESPAWPVPDRATLEAIAAAAHAGRRTVRAHLTHGDELRLALAAGLDGAAHTPIETIPDALLRRAVDRGWILVTTAALWRETPAHQATVLDNLRRWVAAGGRIALGTDAPAFHPGWGAPRLEIETLAAGGIPAAAVLKAATVWGAAAVGREGEIGSLEPGALADLVVLPRDPRLDATALLEGVAVVSAGRIVRDATARGTG